MHTREVESQAVKEGLIRDEANPMIIFCIQHPPPLPLSGSSGVARDDPVQYGLRHVPFDGHFLGGRRPDDALPRRKAVRRLVIGRRKRRWNTKLGRPRRKERLGPHIRPRMQEWTHRRAPSELVHPPYPCACRQEWRLGLGCSADLAGRPS